MASLAARWFSILACIYWLLIFLATHIPVSHLPHINLWDKYEHLLAYGGLGGVLFLALWSRKPNFTQLGVLVLAIGMMYGAIDEWLQALPFVHRDCEMGDWMADCAGLAIAVVCMTYIRYRIQRKSGNATI